MIADNDIVMLEGCLEIMGLCVALIIALCIIKWIKDRRKK